MCRVGTRVGPGCVSNVTCSSPRKPYSHSSRVAALVSMMNSITNLPMPFRTVIAIASL